MNKKKGIIIGAFALIITMVVGYALFGKDIEINGTATASGNFDMAVTCIPGLESSIATTSDLGIGSEGGYKNDVCQVNDNIMNFSSELLYPGAIRYFTAKITNSGTIDAVFNPENNVTVSGKTCIDGFDGTDFDVNKNGELEESECLDINQADGVFKTVDIYSLYGYEKKTGEKINLVNAAEDEISDLLDTDGNLLISPGDSIYVLLGTSVSDVFNGQVNGSKGNSILIKSDVKMVFTFSQIAAK